MTKTNRICEVVVPDGYSIDEVMDMADDFEEEPIMQEEVRVRFE